MKLTAMFLSALAIGAFAFSALHAHAQAQSSAPAFDDALEALSALKQAEPAYTRALQWYSPVCSNAGLILDASGWRCPGDSAVRGQWRGAVYSLEGAGMSILWVWVCAKSSAAERCSPTRTNFAQVVSRERPGFMATRLRDAATGAQRGVDAMNFFTRLRPVRDPASDTDFRAALLAAPTDATQPEALRRVQVQVEGALSAGRTLDAARLYRDALRTAPGWADGHYNIGLVYGELHLYPEAITAMRRYLYLSPNAADARAVQDQIYTWEAAMTQGGSQ